MQVECDGVCSWLGDDNAAVFFLFLKYFVTLFFSYLLSIYSLLLISPLSLFLRLIEVQPLIEWWPQ